MSTVSVRGLRKRFGDTEAVAGIDFEVPEGHFLTLLGPSGCGKTTTLRCLAGLERPDAGEVLIDGEPVVSVARRLWVPPEKRRLGMVFQSYAVWPHLTVFDNVAYGLRVRRLPRAEIAARTREALATVGLADLAHRYATQLSGGQQQRVALARALAYRPRLLLCDEPLSNLDARLREEMRLELKRLQHQLGITTVYVTHDQSEALALSDTVIVMAAGRIVQQGDPETLYTRPANRFVAEFMGAANLLPVRVLQHTPLGTWVETAWGTPQRLRCADCPPLPAGSAALLVVRPEDLCLAATPVAAADNRLQGQVRDVIYLGNTVECRLDVQGQELQVRLSPDAEPPRGTTQYVHFAATACRCLPP